MPDFALVLIKPDAFLRNLDGTILRLLKEAGLEVVTEKMIQLDEPMIRAYQPVLNEPSEFGEKWKEEAITALTSRPVLVLLLQGENALKKTRLLKKEIRVRYCPGIDYRSRVIFNLLHTADNLPELRNNIKVLIPEVWEERSV